MFSCIGLLIFNFAEKYSLLRLESVPEYINDELMGKAHGLLTLLYVIPPLSLTLIAMGNARDFILSNKVLLLLPPFVPLVWPVIKNFFKIVFCATVNDEEIEKEMLEYDVARFVFSRDYDRANPVTAKDGHRDYLEYLKLKEDELLSTGSSPLAQIVENINIEMLQSIRRGVERTTRIQGNRISENNSTGITDLMVGEITVMAKDVGTSRNSLNESLNGEGVRESNVEEIENVAEMEPGLLNPWVNMKTVLKTRRNSVMNMGVARITGRGSVRGPVSQGRGLKEPLMGRASEKVLQRVRANKEICLSVWP
eukprot:TRINITY_DN4915_c0_g1_i1.p1 TRINITY_DN4915_c0_g1~~TRINITY_DN4915_c0_g1_i1.p1  ORF type:complete len:310 (-),score=74.00 TRINITY_DN4915_c0_g1_i1:159-1088(-)